MTLLKYITAMIGGGALGFFISNQFITGNYALAVLGIGILALYFNLLFNMTPTRVIVREVTREKPLELPPLEPRLLFKRKAGVIENATVEISKLTNTPYINLVIKTKSFKHHGKLVEELYKPISLTAYAGPFNSPLDNLKEATGVEPKFLSERNTFEPGQIITNLIGLPLLFELEEVEYIGTMRLKVGTLYKAPNK